MAASAMMETGRIALGSGYELLLLADGAEDLRDRVAAITAAFENASITMRPKKTLADAGEVS